MQVARGVREVCVELGSHYPIIVSVQVCACGVINEVAPQVGRVLRRLFPDVGWEDQHWAQPRPGVLLNTCVLWVVGQKMANIADLVSAWRLPG